VDDKILDAGHGVKGGFADRLVPRTRSSHKRAASPIANFGFKGAPEPSKLLVSL